jgi:hypothetical protein
MSLRIEIDWETNFSKWFSKDPFISWRLPAIWRATAKFPSIIHYIFSNLTTFIFVKFFLLHNKKYICKNFIVLLFLLFCSWKYKYEELELDGFHFFSAIALIKLIENWGSFCENFDKNIFVKFFMKKKEWKTN